MGRSLRRAKRTRPKATMGKKKKPKTRAKKPLQLHHPSIAEKLGVEQVWDREKGLASNYASNSFKNNPNAGFGRNAEPAPQVEPMEAAAEGSDAEVESDDDLRAAEGKMRRTGKAPPQKLTTHQRQVMERLISAHGENVEAMARDAKLNAMLLTEGKLRVMLGAYKLHGSKGRCGFRVPRKGL